MTQKIVEHANPSLVLSRSWRVIEYDVTDQADWEDSLSRSAPSLCDLSFLGKRVVEG